MSECDSVRIYLHPNGQVRAVGEPGRCKTYWWVYQKHLQGDKNAIHYHILACEQCRAWFDLSEQISARTGITD